VRPQTPVIIIKEREYELKDNKNPFINDDTENEIFRPSSPSKKIFYFVWKCHIASNWMSFINDPKRKENYTTPHCINNTYKSTINITLTPTLHDSY